jgi:hypothetical protein
VSVHRLRYAIQQYVVYRLLGLCQWLQVVVLTEQTEDVPSQLNVVMHMLLSREVSLDFTESVKCEDTVQTNLMDLVLVSQNLGDETMHGEIGDGL